MEHVNCKHESEIASILDTNKELRTASQTHITTNQFWTVVLLLCGIFGGIMTTNFNKIGELQAKTSAQEVNNAKIVTQLSQIQVDILDIKLSLKEDSKPNKK
jgi:hypothetical protein